MNDSLVTWYRALGEDWFSHADAITDRLPTGVTIYPPSNERLAAFELVAFDDVKVIILGQDPYHQPKQAHGLAFSFHGVKPLPKSLVNIFRELRDDLGIDHTFSGDLTKWAKQGILLLNTILTVEQGLPLSHVNMGWQQLTLQVIKKLNEDNNPKVFILWGSEARKLSTLLNHSLHLVIESAHPSPLSAYRGFFGSKPFSKVNEFLINHHLPPIEWSW